MTQYLKRSSLVTASPWLVNILHSSEHAEQSSVHAPMLIIVYVVDIENQQGKQRKSVESNHMSILTLCFNAIYV